MRHDEAIINDKQGGSDRRNMLLEKCMSKSLMYDRAYARLQIVIQALAARQKADDRFDLENGNTPDVSYDLMLEDLKRLQESYRTECDRLWEMAELQKEVRSECYENLANAIITKAVEDYEMAICGFRDTREMLLIEKFAKYADQGDVAFTKLNIQAMLERVREAQKEFQEIAKTEQDAIIRETKKNRTKKHDLGKYNTHRCPLCGGAMFDDVFSRVHRIACTNCYLFEIVKVDKKKAI